MAETATYVTQWKDGGVSGSGPGVVQVTESYSIILAVDVGHGEASVQVALTERRAIEVAELLLAAVRKNIREEDA